VEKRTASAGRQIKTPKCMLSRGGQVTGLRAEQEGIMWGGTAGQANLPTRVFWGGKTGFTSLWRVWEDDVTHLITLDPNDVDSFKGKLLSCARKKQKGGLY